MLKKLKLSAYEGAIRTGGFFGWYLTVMFICQNNAGSADLIEKVNRTFLFSGVISVFAILLIMIFFDFEGILGDKYLRWIPGLFMAESGIALCLAEARNMTLFAAIAGVSASIGAVAMISSLLRVKVSQRIFSVGAGLAIGGIIRVAGNFIISLWGGRTNNVGEIITAVLIGIIAAVSVHTTSFSKEAKPLVSKAEAKPSEIFRKIPAVYVWVFLLGSAFMMCFGTIEKYCSNAMTPAFSFGNKYYNVIAFLAFALVSVLAVFIVRPHALASLFAVGSAFAVCSVILLGLSSPTQAEAIIITILCYAAFACYKMCMYLIVVTFSLDRPHPLFYALFGYGVITASEWMGRIIGGRLEENIYRTVVAVLLVLIPVGAFFISRSMRFSGYSQEQLQKRHRIRQLIARVGEEKELSDREKTILNLVVLDGYNADMLPNKLGISKNTVKTQLRTLLGKFEVSTLEELTEKLYALIEENEEQLRLEEAQKAEEKSVLAALAAQDAEAEEKFEKGETAAEETEAEPEEKEEAEKEEKAEPEEKKEEKISNTGVIDISELEKASEPEKEEVQEEAEKEEDKPETEEKTEAAEETRPVTEEPAKKEEKASESSEKASVRVIRRKRNNQNGRRSSSLIPEKPKAEKPGKKAEKPKAEPEAEKTVVVTEEPSAAETVTAPEEPSAVETVVVPPAEETEEIPEEETVVTPKDRLDDLLADMDDED